MSDYLVRGTAGEGQIRAFAILGTDMVEEARKIHHTSPVMTAALGRLLMAGSMMGSMLKEEDGLLTLQIKGEGEGGGLVVTANERGNVKGYAVCPQVICPPNARGKLDVGGAIGPGSLTVIKDIGLKEPYIGHTELVSGEIAEDITAYFAESEQIPSSVGLGVLMERDNTVRKAGGFILQLMPFAEEETIRQLERNLSGLTSVTALLEEGHTPEKLLESLLEGLEPEIKERRRVSYQCDCSRERVERALAGMGRDQLAEIIEEGKPIETGCQFCGRTYEFEPEELRELLHGKDLY